MPDGKRMADVDIIAHGPGQLLKVLMLGFIAHCPVANEGSNSDKYRRQNIIMIQIHM